MAVTRAEIDILFAMARDAAEAEILPHFANLNPSEIRTKAHATDFVTVADEAAERFIHRRVRETFGEEVFFLGEELVARDPSQLDRLGGAERAIVVDPIDGTFNYANGLPLFAVIIAVLEKGEVAGGLIYDPMRGDAAAAIAGAGAWLMGGGRPEQPLRVAEPAPLAEMNGCAGFSYVDAETRRTLLGGLARSWGVCNYRCGGQEMRMLAAGGVHFAYYHKLSPWDHAAGWLIHKEAGGYARVLDGSPYRPELRSGGLLLATDEASWTELAAAISGR